MKISVSVDERPDFDLALKRAIKKLKEIMYESDEAGCDDLWSVPFRLLSIEVDDNFRRTEFEYIFEVEKEIT